ncbi:cytochrome c oxidase assembly factor Coa1 family protein [Dyadobacter frigoris]|uniref:cytochrome c oxidase assembly factor Coa1 family protein n=1 Tax=Dyadobacter frigoris TaxID=2576211 RepID=UPI00255633C3|nr:cytochrome c oxidase assembly factor Coa1 family protein [Dyadobacter frigoris]
MTLIGLFHWFKFYKLTRGHYPKFLTALRENQIRMRKNPFAGMEFMFKHILEFWTFSILFWMTLVLIMVLTFRESEAFEATKRYCENDREILSKTGKVRYFGILIGGEISTKGESGSADLSFTIVGEKGNFSSNSQLTKSNDEWTVDNLTVR